MFEVSPFCAYRFMQWITTLIHCSVNNVLIKTTPLFNQSFFQMVDVTDLAAVDSFLQNAPNSIVHRIAIWTVWWPIQWDDEVGCFSCLMGTGGRGTVLLGGEDSRSYHRLYESLTVTEICDSSLKKLKIS